MSFRNNGLLLIGLALLLPACDTLKEELFPDEISFDGVTYAAIGQAELFVENAGLVVSNIGTSGNDGVRVEVEGHLQEADIRTRPVAIPANGRWGLQLFGDLGGARTALATVWHEAVDDETHRIEFDYAPGLGIEAVTLEYYLDRQIVARVPGVPLGAAKDGGARRIAPAGHTSAAPQSVHVILVGGVYVVATDHGGAAPKNGCTGALVEVDFPDVPSPICTDFIRAVPETTASFPEATSLEVRARTLERFTIEDGDVR